MAEDADNNLLDTLNRQQVDIELLRARVRIQDLIIDEILDMIRRQSIILLLFACAFTLCVIYVMAK